MNPDRHLSSEELDLLELGRLEGDERSAAEGHLSRCASCSSHLEALRRDAAHFRQYVHPRVADRTTARAARRLGAPRWLALAFTAVAATVAVFVVQRGVAPPDTYVAARGEPVFRAVVARGEGRAEVLPDSRLGEGDRLRFIVDPAGARYVLVLSRDGAGAWSVYAPFGGTESVELEPGEAILPGAVELDATRGREHLIAIFSETPISAPEAIAALREQRWPPLRRIDVPGARAVKALSFDKP